MIELGDMDLKYQNNLYLIVRLDSVELAVPIDQIDGIKQFTKEIQKESTHLDLGRYHFNNHSIPIINLKKYLGCPDPFFTHTFQSRIVILTSLISNLTIGVGFEAIRGIFHNVKKGLQINKTLSNGSNLNCFNLDSCIRINSKVYPILDLKKLIDFSYLKKLFHP